MEPNSELLLGNYLVDIVCYMSKYLTKYAIGANI